MTDAEFKELIKQAGPEFSGMDLAEFRQLALRYGKSDPALKAVLAGQPTRGAIAEAMADEEEQAALRRYPSMRGTK